MGDFMIQLTYDKKDNIVYTNWILNISIDTKKAFQKMVWRKYTAVTSQHYPMNYTSSLK